MGRPRVFLDSSVLITALLSSRGASYALLRQGKRHCDFFINEYVLAEVQDVLQRKFVHRPNLRSDLFLLLGLARVEVLPSPLPSALEPFEEIIEREDVPILASAVAACDYLVTLDNDFLAAAVQDVAAERGLIICAPGELLERGG